jgi:hypothetical protein
MKYEAVTWTCVGEVFSKAGHGVDVRYMVQSPKLWTGLPGDDFDKTC